MDNLIGRVRRCMEDYEMISPGDVVYVGLSGGKDSAALLWALAELRRYYPVKYELRGITLAMGIEGMDYSPIADWCKALDVPYMMKETELAKLIFETRQEKNPCALCSKMRRGSLNDAIIELGGTKLALGHHFDDAVNTFMMCLVNEGRLGCFEPVTYMSRSGVTQIRPLLYCEEKSILQTVEKLSLPVVKSLCPVDKKTSREDASRLVSELAIQYPDIKNKVFGAMQRLPLKGWQPTGHPRGR